MTTEARPRALHDCRDAFSSALVALAEDDPTVVVVVNDSVGSSKLQEFASRFPSRLINVGIAEQNMVGVAAGLAASGLRPFVSAAACFLTARAMEQTKVDLAYSEHPVVLCGMSPGMAYGELGPTHHSIEDLAWMRTIPNMSVVVPSDRAETEQAVRWSAQHDGPIFLRVSRMKVPDVNAPGYQFRPGRGVRLREGTDATIIATGTTVHRALDAAELLVAEGLQARVVSMPSIKPLDTAEVLAAARETGCVVTVEEALDTGGLGGAVAEVIVQHEPVPMRFVGVPGVFAPTGSAEWLMDHFGISPEGIARRVREVVASRR